MCSTTKVDKTDCLSLVPQSANNFTIQYAHTAKTLHCQFFVGVNGKDITAVPTV